MKKIIFAAVFLLSAFYAFSDDGGSFYPEDWTYGNIYVKEPNEKIALEKELMIVEHSSKWAWEDEAAKTLKKLHGNEVEAIFGFRNTSSQNVVVPCAFPVVVSTQVTVKKDGFLSNYIEVGNGFNSKLDILQVALGKKLKLDEERGWDKNIWGTTDATKDELLSLDKKLRTIPINDYLSELKNYKASETLNPCQIVQDGKKVAVQTVGIETSIEKHDEYTKALEESSYRHDQAEVYTIKVVLHFFHELNFKPASSSTLSVKYAIDAAKGGRSYRHSFVYDISTGGTWKGDIKSFIVLTDSSMDIKNSKTKFEITDLGEMCNWKRTYLYCAENYKPQKDEYFVFDLNSYGYDGDVWLSNRKSMQDFVSGVRASSELSGSYKMAGKKSSEWATQNSGECNEDSNLENSTYEAKTSFDGNLLNGWVEGVKGDGIGEWIEFTLSKNVLGPFATNGLRRFGGSLKRETENGLDWYYYDEKSVEPYNVYKNAGGIKSTWESNNRVKSMLLSSEGKNIAELQFEDKCLEVLTTPADWIWQSAVKNPQLLKAGTYRMTINSVYKGKKWDDTVLGEVWFVPIEDKAGKAILSDDFFKKPIIQKTSQFLFSK